MNSIRSRLFFNIGLLLLFLILVAWVLNALFLESYYTENKRRSVIESARAIDALYGGGSRNISLEMERIAANTGATIFIMDKNGALKYSSFESLVGHPPFGRRTPHPEDGEKGGPAFHPPGPPRPVLSSYTVDARSVIEIEEDSLLNIKFMVLRHELADGGILLISLPLAAVAESAAYAGRFMAFSGLLAMAAGCVWAYFFARRFTAPLEELSMAAQSMARLDFSRKCRISGNDELGKLGESINNLSARLDEAVGELNEKNRQLAADVEKERSLDRLRKNFISSVSHELKTPISLILGYAEGLRENVARDAEGRNYYSSVIIDEAARMDKLVTDLLDLSQVESGFFRMQRQDFDLALLVDDILLKYRNIFADKKITPIVDKKPSVLANGDVLRIEQVLINLLNNAIDHTEKDYLIRLTVAEAGDKLRVSVYNSGRQIPPDSLDNLWLSFYKVDQARTRGVGGYGLGLSIVRAIQELHGNAYGVENTEGGVVFWFELDKAV